MHLSRAEPCKDNLAFWQERAKRDEVFRFSLFLSESSISLSLSDSPLCLYLSVNVSVLSHYLRPTWARAFRRRSKPSSRAAISACVRLPRSRRRFVLSLFLLCCYMCDRARDRSALFLTLSRNWTTEARRRLGGNRRWTSTRGRGPLLSRSLCQRRRARGSPSLKPRKRFALSSHCE